MNHTIEISLKLYSVTVTKKDKQPHTYNFTTEDVPITYKGHQYVPISQSDAERWGLLNSEGNR